jgi:cytochrome c biogenesis protein CcdA
MPEPDKPELRQIAYYLDGFTIIVTGIGAAAAALAMVVLFVAGLIEVWHGAILTVKAWILGEVHVTSAAVITQVIHGVEILLLAPVAYLVFVALGKYLRRPVDDTDSEQAHRELLDVKAFITGLLFAIVATDTVGKALQSKLVYESAIASTLLMAVIGSFFVALEKFRAVHR